MLLISPRSLTATMSISGSCHALRKKQRPILPNPFIATFIFFIARLAVSLSNPEWLRRFGPELPASRLLPPERAREPVRGQAPARRRGEYWSPPAASKLLLRAQVREPAVSRSPLPERARVRRSAVSKEAQPV